MKGEQHGMTGQKNAVKYDVPATSKLTVRVTPQDKNKFVLAAEQAGMNLSEWVIDSLNATVEHESQGV